MQSVSTTIQPGLKLFLFFLTGSMVASAQENSPFSRYGLGDVYPSQNIVNRSLGGVTSTYADNQSVNFSNPASYANFKLVTYDIGLTLDSRTLRSESPVEKYNSVNVSPGYVALGLPLSSAHNVGLALGLRPISKVSYSVIDGANKQGDSVLTRYEGSGGLYQAFVGLGKGWINAKTGGGLSLGFNTGVMFGSKNNTTITVPVDTVVTYKSNSTSEASYNHVFFNAGLQYVAVLSKTSSLHLGFSGNMKYSLNGKRTVNRETFTYDVNGAQVKIDSVYTSPEESGKIDMPASYTAGISLNTNVINNFGFKVERSSLAVEYETTKWSNYRFFGQPDRLINSSVVRVGASLTPNPFSTKSYWNTVTYRAGFYFGKEAVNADGNELPVYAITLGGGFRVRKWRSSDNQFTNVNTTFEFGKRGNSSNNITESFFKFSLGFNLSDRWFIKRKYD